MVLFRQPPLPWLHPSTLIATWFWSGLIRKAPGTWGSLAALPFGYSILQSYGRFGLIIATVIIFAIGYLATEVYEKAKGDHDPSEIVVDEVVGMWIVLLAMPETWLGYLVAFGFFRLFDIVKAGPVGWVDRNFHGAYGVMMDDVIAGLLGLASFCALHQIVGGL